MRRGLILKIALCAAVVAAGAIVAVNSYVRHLPMTAPLPDTVASEFEFHALEDVRVATGIAGFLRAGDHLDLYVTDGQGVTSLLVPRARLAGVSSDLADADQTQGSVPLDMAFRLTPAQRAALEGRVAGSVVSAALVGAADDVAATDVAVDQRDLLGIARPAPKPSDTAADTAEDIRKHFARRSATGVTRGVQFGVGNSPAAEPDPAQALVDQLKAADLAFNRPARMTYGAAVRVELVLAPDTVSSLADLPADASVQSRAEAVGLTAELAGETRVVEDVRFATRMQAVLSGPDFEVEPPGPQARTVLADAAAKWVWTVKPKAHGADKLLTLDVQAIVERNGRDMPPAQIRVFREVVPVDITLWGRLVLMSADIKAVHGMLAALGGTLLAALGWLWQRRRAKAPAAKPDPLEVIVTHKSGS